MSLLLKTSVMVMLSGSVAFPQDPMTVISSGWERIMIKGIHADGHKPTPAKAVTNDDKYFQRKAREQRTDIRTDPSETTIDGRSAAIDRAVQESRAPKAEDVNGYSYTAKVRNDSGKTVNVIFWEYRFTELARPTNVVRRQFLCAVKLKNGEVKDLSASSRLGPSEVVDTESLSKPSDKLFNENVTVNRLEFSDGTVRQRGNWKFDDVKTAVERATAAPWAGETCRML